MYEIKPQSLKTFIEDSSIKLPRFQRKKTWNPEKNFLLAVSVFKGYPLGVTILNMEKDKKTKRLTKWLLDGRQRRTALTEMLYDPEKIYFWAKKYIKFKNNDQPNDVINKFVEKISEYIEYDLDENTENDDSNDDVEQITDNTDVIDDSIDEEENEQIKKAGLQLLAKLIRLTHNEKTKGTGLTLPFDFSKYVKDLYYVENDGRLNCRKLKSWLSQYDTYCIENQLSYDEYMSFVSFTESRNAYIDDKKNKFITQVSLVWPQLLERIDLLKEIEDLFIGASIGLIEISDITTTDSQKIFNIINTGGTMLTSAEILSAKPSWNVPINNPDDNVLSATRKLYKQIDVTTDGVVKWDIPATMLYRLDYTEYLFGDLSEDKTDFERKITLGFKLLSGILNKGMKKDDISKLSTLNINWNSDVDKIINDLNILFKLVSESAFFKFLATWKISIRELLSENIALDFILLLYTDWINKGKTVSDNNAKKVQKNAFILFDRLMYEYVSGQWLGSGDTKVARSLANFNTMQTDGMFIKIEDSKWEKLISDIIDNNKIEDSTIDQRKVTPLLYYYYCLKSIAGPNDPKVKNIEVDHIIPQTLFEDSTIENKKVIKDNLFNLALLPKAENISKSNKRLIEITDRWLSTQIVTYEEIKEVDFRKYSDVNNYLALKEERGQLIKKTFKDDRQSWLNN